MYFPATCVDDFYNDPDKVREFALSLDYSKQKQVNHPGVRSPYLHTVDKDFFDKFCYKLFSVFFNLNYDSVKWNVETSFQKTYTYDAPDEIFNEVNSGWIHQDGGIAFAGVIYLNPKPNLDSGTTICNLNDRKDRKFIREYNWNIRNDFYNQTGLDVNEYAKLKSEYNSRFHDVLEFKNVYNRLICYDSDYLHKESSFLMDSEEFRLTQVFFVNEIKLDNSSVPPYLRCKSYDL